jgi:hypothetical protein
MAQNTSYTVCRVVLWTVVDAMRGDVNNAVYWAMDWAVFYTVDWAVSDAVDNAVEDAVEDAERDAVYSECPHPGLEDFLLEVGVEV